jgi:2-polyprenyl-3-methyl-5-hydroxy-6-metoxy-1,4-benzoquinol methylase
VKYFVRPPDSVYHSSDSSYIGPYKTYTEYNYLRPGVASLIKSLHFEAALELTKQRFHACNVLDVGCADGVFIPSLAKYFNHVGAVDIDYRNIETTTKVVNALALNNVVMLCNNGLAIDEIKSRLSGTKYSILFLLETLEHVGSKDSLYLSKVEFLRSLFSLLEDDGIIVISVPNMIGLSFLVQRLGLALTGSVREPVSVRNFLKAVMLNSTDDLERQWTGGHLGFNHKKLEEGMKKEFRLLQKRNLFFQLVYVVARR